MSKNQLKEFKIPENGSRSVRMREKWISLGENGASGLQKLILGSQGGPKMEPRWLKMGPRWSQEEPKMEPRWPKEEGRKKREERRRKKEKEEGTKKKAEGVRV